MLPWLAKNKDKMLSTLMDGRGNRTEVTPDVDMSEDKDSDNHELRAACTALLTAIERKSIPDLMEAFHSAFQAAEKTPHEEGPHTEEQE
jgi:hypothetical protein